VVVDDRYSLSGLRKIGSVMLKVRLMEGLEEICAEHVAGNHLDHVPIYHESYL